MQARFRLVVGLVLVWTACSGGDGDDDACSTHESQLCEYDTLYWVDGCGEREEEVESCEHGCNAAGDGCAAAPALFIELESYYEPWLVTDTEINLSAYGTGIVHPATVSFLVNGEVFATEVLAEGVFRASAVFAIEQPVAVQYAIQVEIEDADGRVAWDDAVMYVDYGPPTLAVSPGRFSDVVAPFDVEVSVVDDNEPVTVTVSINETSLCVMEQAPYTCTVSADTSAGELALLVTAEDVAGQVTEVSYPLNLGGTAASGVVPGFSAWNHETPAHLEELGVGIAFQAAVPIIAMFDPALRAGPLEPSLALRAHPTRFISDPVYGTHPAFLAASDGTHLIYVRQDEVLVDLHLGSDGSVLTETVLTELRMVENLHSFFAAYEPETANLHVVMRLEGGRVGHLQSSADGVEISMLNVGERDPAWWTFRDIIALTFVDGQLYGVTDPDTIELLNMSDGTVTASTLDRFIAVDGGAILGIRESDDTLCIEMPLAGVVEIVRHPAPPGGMAGAVRSTLECAVAYADSGTVHSIYYAGGVLSEAQVDTGYEYARIAEVAWAATGPAHVLVAGYGAHTDVSDILHGRLSGSTLEFDVVDRKLRPQSAALDRGPNGDLWIAWINQRLEPPSATIESVAVVRLEPDPDSWQELWRTEVEVCPGGSGRLEELDLAVDSSGNVHLAVDLGGCSSTSGNRYLRIPSGAGAADIDEKLPQHGMSLRIAVGPDQQPQITSTFWGDSYNQQLCFVQRAGDGSWSTFTTDEARDMVTSPYPVEVAADGTTWLLAADWLDGDSRLFLYTKSAGIDFDSHQLTAYANRFPWVWYDLALDSSGLPHVAYYDNQEVSLQHLVFDGATATEDLVTTSVGCGPDDNNCLNRPVTLDIADDGGVSVLWWDEPSSSATGTQWYPTKAPWRYATNASGSWQTLVLPNVHITNDRGFVFAMGNGSGLAVIPTMHYFYPRALVWATFTP